MIDYQYRLFIIKTTVRVVGTPSLLLFALFKGLSRLGCQAPPTWLSVALYAIATPLYWLAKRAIDSYLARHHAKRLGARLVPVLNGKWPGNLDLIQRLVARSQDGYVGEIIDELLNEAGCDTVNVPLLWQDKIFTRDPQVSKFVLSTGFNSFEKGPLMQMTAYALLGKGIFASDGTMAKYHRSFARPYFARERSKDRNIFEQYANKTLSILRQVSEADEPCDIQEIFSRYSMDLGIAFLLGLDDVDSLNATLPVPRQQQHPNVMGPFYQAYNQAASALPRNIAYQKFVHSSWLARQNIMKRRISGYGWYFTEFLRDKVSPHIVDVRAYIDPISIAAIEERKRREAVAQGPAQQPKEDITFLQHLAASSDDPTFVKDQIVNMVLALRDTTACCFTFTCYMLAAHPHVLKKLREEILQVCGTGGVPSLEDKRELPYLRAVIDETLRIFPPTALNERSSKEPCVIPTSEAAGPIYIPYAGAPITYTMIAMHRRKDIWGEDAEEFRPERWFTEDGKPVNVDPCVYLPWGIGPRDCLGRDFAYNQISYFMIRLLQMFDTFTLVQDECAPLDCLPPLRWKNETGRRAIEKVWPITRLTVSSKGGLWIKLGKTKP